MAKRREEDDPKRPTPVARDGAYVMMLIISLLALIGGCVLMYLDTEEYGGKSPPKENAPVVQPLGTAAKVDSSGPGPGPAPGPGPGPAPGPMP